MENQNIEYKENWRDEYIKWICGFANASGGIIYIGINDDGVVTGVVDAKKLLEDIPNKTKDVLGIIVDVNLKTKEKATYIEIVVEPYPYPINFRGQYHYRTGSTKQELKGAALDKFILQKQGKHWDAVPQPNFSVNDFSKNALTYFKTKAINTQRVDLEILKEKTPQLIQKLHLNADATYLKRACVLLFYPDPEKYITGSYVKIGFFYTDDDLAYQDEIHGHLFEQVEKTIDLLLTKYLKATISYNNLNRIEEYPIPEKALREAVLNAIVHKDYSSGNPIQISVYSDKLIIWNAGQLPNNWTVATLKTKHASQPNNPDIANCFFRAGLIEAWGRGTIKIINECKLAKIDLPVFNNQPSEFWVQFTFKPAKLAIKKASTKIFDNTTSHKVLHLLANNGAITIAEMAKQIGVTNRTVERILKQFQTQNTITRSGSDKTGTWIINEMSV